MRLERGGSELGDPNESKRDFSEFKEVVTASSVPTDTPSRVYSDQLEVEFNGFTADDERKLEIWRQREPNAGRLTLEKLGECMRESRDHPPDQSAVAAGGLIGRVVALQKAFNTKLASSDTKQVSFTSIPPMSEEDSLIDTTPSVEEHHVVGGGTSLSKNATFLEGPLSEPSGKGSGKKFRLSVNVGAEFVWQMRRICQTNANSSAKCAAPTFIRAHVVFNTAVNNATASDPNPIPKHAPDITIPKNAPVSKEFIEFLDLQRFWNSSAANDGIRLCSEQYASLFFLMKTCCATDSAVQQALSQNKLAAPRGTEGGDDQETDVFSYSRTVQIPWTNLLMSLRLEVRIQLQPCALLTDPPGAGKTVTCIALIGWLLALVRGWPFLIVVPSKEMLGQWRDEIKRLLTGLNVNVGVLRNKSDLDAQLSPPPGGNASTSLQDHWKRFDVLLVSAETVHADLFAEKRYIPTLSKGRFRGIFFDEEDVLPYGHE